MVHLPARCLTRYRAASYILTRTSRALLSAAFIPSELILRRAASAGNVRSIVGAFDSSFTSYPHPPRPRDQFARVSRRVIISIILFTCNIMMFAYHYMYYHFILSKYHDNNYMPSPPPRPSRCVFQYYGNIIAFNKYDSLSHISHKPIDRSTVPTMFRRNATPACDRLFKGCMRDARARTLPIVTVGQFFRRSSDS